METLELISKISNYILPIIGVIALIVFIIVLIKASSTIKKANITIQKANKILDSVDECVERLKPTTYTISSIMATVETARVAIEKFVSGSIDKIAKTFENVKDFIVMLLEGKKEVVEEKTDEETIVRKDAE